MLEIGRHFSCKIELLAYPAMMRHSPSTALADRVLLPILFVLLLFSGAPPSTQPAGFTFNGAPIHPMAVQLLVGDLANELSLAGAVDLEGSAKTSSNRAKVTVENNTVRATDGVGFVGYQHVGTTRGGIHVLIVSRSGGGSGVFEDVLWVKIVRDHVWEDGKNRDRTMLVRAGGFPLGDRDNGSVQLRGSTLLVGKSQYRAKDTTIPLE